MRKLAITLAVSITLGLAATAGAALPSKGEFTGTTSLHAINGFPDLVTFVSQSGGRTLKKFQFGTLGCFGTGAYPVGVDPYGDPTATATVSKVLVSKTGTFLLTAKPAIPGADGTVTTATIKGTFTKSNAVSGTISISQVENGDKCGPRTMKFTAVPGTPESLGYS
jgi:hypothetical protein